MTTISQHQHQILSAAAEASDGAIDTPDGPASSVAGLIKRGMLISLPQSSGLSRLLITQAGRAAIGIDELQLGSGDHAHEVPGAVHPSSGKPDFRNHEPLVPPTAELAPAPKGKIAVLVNLLRCPEGATIEAMMQATGWQAHSVRGAMSASIKKAQGLQVTSEKTGDGRVYKITSEPEA